MSRALKLHKAWFKDEHGRDMTEAEVKAFEVSAGCVCVCGGGGTAGVNTGLRRGGDAGV